MTVKHPDLDARRRRQRFMRAVNVPMRAVLGVIGQENPRAVKFVPIPRRSDGHLNPEILDVALRHGFCIVRWHLGQDG